MSDELMTTEQTAPSIYSQGHAGHLFKVAEQYAKSALVPKHFQGKPADVFVALEMALRIGAPLFQVLQSLYVVHGRPGWSATFLIAMANASGKFKAPIQFKVDKTDPANLSVTAWAVHAASNERVEATVDMAMAKAEGWASRDGNKYRTMPIQMLSYRAATFLVRLYCPEVTLGLSTREELRDITDEVDVEPVAALSPKEQALEEAKAAGMYVPGMENLPSAKAVRQAAAMPQDGDVQAACGRVRLLEQYLNREQIAEARNAAGVALSATLEKLAVSTLDALQDALTIVSNRDTANPKGKPEDLKLS